MQQLLIIDDEPVIREGLKKVIPWADYGYEICGVGVDGEDGLKKIKQYNPDLVLLDIRMPGYTGIELVRQIKQGHYKCKVIILTAYSNFSYAQELIELGVESYLLKPIDEDELIDRLEKINIQQQQEQQIRERLKKFNQMTEKQSIRALLEGKLDDVLPELLTDMKDDPFQVVRFSSHINESFYERIQDQVAQDAEHVKLIRKERDHHLLFIDQTEAEVLSWVETMAQKMPLYGVEDCVFMIGSRVTGPEHIVTSYQQAQSLIDVQFCLSNKVILTYDQETSSENQMNVQKIADLSKEKLHHYVEFQDYKNIQTMMERLETHYQTARFPKERVQAEIIEWVTALMRLITTHYPSISVMNKEAWANTIYAQPNLQHIVRHINTELVTISEAIDKNAAVKGTIVDKVMDYVDRYYNEEISLKMIADLFYYNNAYLGKLFKSETGIFFNEYLHHVRIENAKRLLKEKPYKVYEIAECVGYSNSDYFYKNFKEREGMSPKAYQMKQLQKTRNIRGIHRG